MAVLHDYMCSEHGIFESMEAKCPMKFCKGELSKVFLKPVGLKSDKTKATDKNLKNLASDFKMTDIKSTKEGDSQSGYLTRNNTTKEPRPGDSVMWGSQGSFSMQNIMGGNAFRSVRGESVGVKPTEVGVKRGPTTASYIADHENLKIDK